MIEAKMGTKRSLERSARASLLDLLAYERAFTIGLDGMPSPVGLGIAWGSGLYPATSRHMLCTPDAIPEALEVFMSAPSFELVAD